MLPQALGLGIAFVIETAAAFLLHQTLPLATLVHNDQT
jgi:hypothetical protein